MFTEQDHEIIFKILVVIAVIAAVLGVAGWIATLFEKWFPSEW